MQTFVFSYIGEGGRMDPRYYFSASAALFLNTLLWALLSTVFSLATRHHSSPVMVIWAIVFLIAFHVLMHGVLTVFDVTLAPGKMRM